jgi:methylmalonyl-CoA mutase N-terminal domain/subunit
MECTSGPGSPIEAVYDDSKLTDFRPEGPVSEPGTWPSHRGVYPRRHAKYSWTVHQYAESSPATEAERRYRDQTDAPARAISIMKSGKYQPVDI